MFNHERSFTMGKIKVFVSRAIMNQINNIVHLIQILLSICPLDARVAVCVHITSKVKSFKDSCLSEQYLNHNTSWDNSGHDEVDWNEFMIDEFIKFDGYGRDENGVLSEDLQRTRESVNQ